jgi:NAD(P)-dependent dehydrogenase (short-subunit alcohol dehydrogenase family)
MIHTTMEGKICLITGGTNGIGKSTAQGLAKLGATVVIVGRNATKTAQVVEAIRAASGNKNVNSLLADLSSQQEVRRLADEFKSTYPHLHVLLNNVGAAFQTIAATIGEGVLDAHSNPLSHHQPKRS